MTKTQNIVARIRLIDQQIAILSERLYQPQIKLAEQKEIQRKHKKLNKDKTKLLKKLDSGDGEK
jgi:hypothetical protein